MCVTGVHSYPGWKLKWGVGEVHGEARMSQSCILLPSLSVFRTLLTEGRIHWLSQRTPALVI